jgi:hypothetical protein
MWGLNAVGPFRTAPGGYKHILVAVDKFTKWIVVQPIAKVMSEEVVKFIRDIKHRFGVPNRIITDLGKDNLIDVYYPSVTHPRCNGQVERANGMVLQALKDCIYDDASNYATRWLAELPHVIWGLKTQVSSATGFSPFFLYYLPMSLSELHGSSSTRKERPSKHVASTSTALKNKDSPPSRDKLVMTNSYVAIMIATLGKLPSTLPTSSSNASRRLTTCTSSLPLGRDLSSSQKSSVRLHIDSSGATDKEYPTLGTWSIYDDSIRRIVLNSSYVFLFLVLFFFQIK